MRTEIHQDRTRKGECVVRSPDELWLDQDVTGEELIELDPLEDTKDLMALAHEAMGRNDSLRRLPRRQCSDRVWKLKWRVLKAELRAKHGMAKQQPS